MTPTCTEFASSWPWAFPRPDERTNDTHASMVKRFAEEFGETPLDAITRADARQFADRHPGHVRYVRTMFNDAIDDALVRDNPFAGLRMGRRDGRRGIVVPAPEQIAALVSASSPAFGSMIRFAAYTGLRLGELLALTPDDLTPGFVSVTKQADRRGRMKPPKAGSYGTVLVPQQALRTPSKTKAIVTTDDSGDTARKPQRQAEGRARERSKPPRVVEYAAHGRDGAHGAGERLHHDPARGGTLGCRAPDGSGAEPRPTTEEGRERAPQERDPVGQSTGEPRVVGERYPLRPAVERDHALSELRLLAADHRDGLIWPYPRSTHWALWDASRRAVGVDFDFHVLRHFCATNLLDRGATAEDVAIQLRHSDGGALVRSLYGHADPMLALERLRTLA